MRLGWVLVGALVGFSCGGSGDDGDSQSTGGKAGTTASGGTGNLAGTDAGATGGASAGQAGSGGSCSPTTCPATVAYYVAVTGDDQNPGTEAEPMRTILAAYAKANAGEFVIVEPGTYHETYNDYGLRLDKSGTAAAPITVKSRVKWKAVLDGQNDPAHHNVLWLDGAYNVVQDFEIANGYAGGVVLYGNDNTLSGCHIHHNGNGGDPASTYGQDGVYSDSGTRGNRYLANYIHDNGRISIDSNLDHGLHLCGDDELVANNIVVSNCAIGLQIAGYEVVSNMRVYNNVFADNGRSGVVIWLDVAGVELKNNLFYRNARYAIGSWDAHGSGVVLDHNAYFGNTAGELDFTSGGSDYAYSNIQSFAFDPAFVDPASADFHLQAGSPAIDVGLTIPELGSDFDGVSRPQGAGQDLGAYER